MPTTVPLIRSTERRRARRKARARRRSRPRYWQANAILADGPGSQLEIRGGYDALNRLTNTDIIINGVTTPQNLTYNALGNLLSKTGVGTYTYADPLHKHAVTAAGSNSYAYDANGNLTGGAGRTVSWTAWNMPSSITSNGTTQSWLYDPEHSRYKLTASGRTTWYLNPSVHTGGHYEQTQYASGTVEHRVTLYGGGKPIGEVLTFTLPSGTAPAQTRYFHSDAQGSITAVTNEAGAVVTRFRYDPWGKQTLVSGSNTGIDATRQGHTGHEMLDSGLTHMNGRVYDPVLARFVSADPYVDNPFDLQSLNRYSYVNNNPLGYTDPSGYFKLFGKKWSWWRDKVVKPVVAAYVGYLTFGATQWLVGSSLGGGVAGYTAGTIAAAAAAGATSSLIATGSLDGWQYSALSSLLFYGAGELGQTASNASRVALHATAGCVSAAAAGGDCGTGAASAAVGKFTTIATEGWNTGAQFAAATVAGGTASVIGGGKFANGATTAAFGYLFNCVAHKCYADDYAGKRPGHEYGPFASGVACNVSTAGCLDAARMELGCNSAPGQSACTSIGAENSYSLAGGNPITQYRPSADLIINGTSPGHVLHDGYVVRWLDVNAAGNVRIWTYGLGVNTGYGTAIFNDVSGSVIFRNKGAENVSNIQNRLGQ